MTRWEYMHVNLDHGVAANLRRQNELGLEGWELVTVWHYPASNVYHFKRALPSERSDSDG